MSKHNYSQYSNKNFETVEDVAESVAPVEVESVVEEAVTPMVETVETVTLPETVTGTVVNCTKLNVRVKPNITADVVCVLDVKSEIKIDVAKSNDEWFCVCTAAAVEGYCMRKFVKASL